MLFSIGKLYISPSCHQSNRIEHPMSQATTSVEGGFNPVPSCVVAGRFFIPPFTFFFFSAASLEGFIGEHLCC